VFSERFSSFDQVELDPGAARNLQCGVDRRCTVICERQLAVVSDTFLIRPIFRSRNHEFHSVFTTDLCYNAQSDSLEGQQSRIQPEYKR